MTQLFDLDAIDFITIDTIGPPGQRVFHLQTGQSSQLHTFVLEKEQAAALADSIDQMLDDVVTKFNIITPEKTEPSDLELREPILPAFRIGQMGLGYDSDRDRVILVIHELLPEDSPEEERSARLSARREQMRALSVRTRRVVSGGRRICGNCGHPIDPEGHFCPRSNGHKREPQPD